VVTSGHVTKLAVTVCHTIQSAVVENPTLHGNFMALFYRTGVIANESFTLREKEVCGLLLLWPWPWPDDVTYELDPYYLKKYRMCNMNFLRQGFRKLSPERHGQSVRHDRNYITRRFAGGKKRRKKFISVNC